MISGSKWILVTLKVAKQVVIGFPLQMGMSLEDLARCMAAETLFTTFGALVYKSKFSVFEPILPIFINSTKQLSYRSYKNLTNFQRLKIAKKKIQFQRTNIIRRGENELNCVISRKSVITDGMTINDVC